MKYTSGFVVFASASFFAESPTFRIPLHTSSVESAELMSFRVTAPFSSCLKVPSSGFALVILFSPDLETGSQREKERMCDSYEGQDEAIVREMLSPFPVSMTGSRN